MKVIRYIINALVCGVAVALAAEEGPLVLDKMTVTSSPSDIAIDVKTQDGLITKVLIVEVRKDSLAERNGFKLGMEMLRYRGHGIIGISTEAFEKLRKKPLVIEETSVLYEVKKNEHESSLPLGIDVPESARKSGAPAAMFDRLSIRTQKGDEFIKEVIQFDLKRPISLSLSSAKQKLLIDEACRALMDWQLSAKAGNRDILSALPVILKGKMVAWKVEWQDNTSETAEQLKIDYFAVPGDQSAYPDIEKDVRAQFEAKRQVKSSDIALFSLVVDGNKLRGVFVGIKAGRMFDLTDMYLKRGITTKEEKVNKTPNSDSLLRGNNLPY